jgi:hypothetical protein
MLEILSQFPRDIVVDNNRAGLGVRYSTSKDLWLCGYYGRRTSLTAIVEAAEVGRGASMEEAVADFIKRATGK